MTWHSPARTGKPMKTDKLKIQVCDPMIHAQVNGKYVSTAEVV
jgi:hypothetical protein